jgi:hypothetical protein
MTEEEANGDGMAAKDCMQMSKGKELVEHVHPLGGLRAAIARTTKLDADSDNMQREGDDI